MEELADNPPIAENESQRDDVYVGPRPFQQGERLYGRDREATDLVNLLLGERIVLLFSPSGGGKTSLIHASLIPAMREEGFDVLPVIRVCHESVCSIGAKRCNRYLESTRISLQCHESDADEVAVAQPPAAGPGNDAGTNVVGDNCDREPDVSAPPTAFDLDTYLDDYARRSEATTANAPDEPSDFRPLLLIFDQFEEILTCDLTDLETKREFFEQVGRALRNRDRWAVFSMREDYAASLDPYISLIPARFAAGYRLDLLRSDAARQAVQKPARQAGVDFQDAAAAALIDDLRVVLVQQPDGSFHSQPGPYIEPVQLQIVCRRLWQTRGKADAITEADVQQLGSVSNALGDYYADHVRAAAQQSQVSERAIRDWFGTQLITPLGIRGQVPLGDEQQHGLKPETLQRLVDAYLVRSERRRGATWFELAHDRLIEPVRSDNAEWRQSNMSTLQLQAVVWKNGLRSDLLLVRGEVLQHCETWAEANPDEMTPLDQDFLSACQAQRTREEQTEKIRKLSWFAILGGIAIVVCLAMILMSLFSWSKAHQAWLDRQRAKGAKEAAIETVNQVNAEAKELVGEAKEEASRQAKLAQQRAELLLDTASRARVRPIQPGISVSSREMLAGTICCIVQDASGQKYVLSADHVFASAQAAKGDPIIQPGRADDGSLENDQVAELTAWVPRDTSAPVDAAGAIAKLLPDVNATNEVLAFGPIRGVGTVSVGDEVVAVGRTSPMVRGKVIVINQSKQIVDANHGPVQYRGLIEVKATSDRFAAGGDSGAPVLTTDGKLVGMIYATSKDSSFVMPIQPVLKALDVKLVRDAPSLGPQPGKVSPFKRVDNSLN